MAKAPKPVLHKAIFQLQYKVGLKFFDLLFSAAEELTEFPNDWETNRLSVTLKDVVNHCSLVIKHNTLTYEQDSSDSTLEEKYIQPALERLPKALGITSCARFGYRRQYLVEANMSFESLVSVLNVKLLSQDEILRKIIPHKISDVVYRIDSIEEPYQYHFTIGPVKKEEMPNYIVFNQENHLDATQQPRIYQEIVSKYPEVAILLDIDIYQIPSLQDLPINEALPFLNIAKAKVHSLATNLSAYLLQTKIK